MSADPSRCTPTRHIKRKRHIYCECGQVMVALTVGRDAVVVTILDPIQRATLDHLEAAQK